MKTHNSSKLTRFTKDALLATAIIAPSLLQAQIVNPGFELGTTGWAETGGSGNFTTPASYSGVYQTINPVEPVHFGLITDSGVFTETISQTFTLSGSPQLLSFSYRFLTDEYNDPFFNPVASATLTPSFGSPVTLFSVSRNDLQAGGAGSLLTGASYIDVGTIGQSEWQFISTDLSAFAGQSVTLSFTVDNHGDADFLLDSQLAIDNLQFSPVPEPMTSALLAGGFGLVALLKLRRKNS